MKKVYSSFENGTFCIDIDHARRFGIQHALMVSQFRQGDDRLFVRSFPSGNGGSRHFDEVLPICDDDAMTSLFSAFKPDKSIPDTLCTIDELIAKNKSVDGEEWIGKRPAKEMEAKE